ncbi:MAG: ABC transporter permease, partial [Candidatus Thalassarchaeum sp.]|nr:ABC transporter permease [Candidatus Thalassarchaeum sp.]
IIPGDPAAIQCGDKCGVIVDYTEDGDPISAYEANRIRLKMDDTVTVQFWRYITDLAEGDWGESLLYHRPVIDVVKDAAPITLEMSFLALFIAYPLGIILGIISAVRQDRMFDHVSRFFAIAFVSLPIFWFAMMLQLFLATGTEHGGICDPVTGFLPLIPDTEGGCFPIYGRHDPSYTYPVDGYAWYYPAGGTGFHLVDSWFVTDEKLATLPSEWGSNRLLFKDTFFHLALPCAALGIASTGSLLRYMRASLLEVLHEDYVRTARAKGLSEIRVVIVHACRNALIPIVTILGFSIGGAIGGAVLTETVFAFNGMGRVAVTSIQYLDFAVIMGVTLITSVIFLLSNLIVDITYAIIDPRVRLE